MTVALALWHSSDYVKIVHNDGSEAFLGMHKIRAIWDADGVDRTKDVLEKRKSVGTAPPGYQETPKQSTGKGLRNVLGVAVLVSLTAIVIMAATGGPQF